MRLISVDEEESTDKHGTLLLVLDVDDVGVVALALMIGLDLDEELLVILLITTGLVSMVV